MGLDNKNTVDAAGRPLPGDSCKLVLFVFDDGSVTDEIRRLKLLMDKMFTYVNYVNSETFRLNHPGVGFSDVLVRVWCKRPPNEMMNELEAVGVKADPTRRLKIEFSDWDQSLAALKSKLSPSRESRPLGTASALGVTSDRAVETVRHEGISRPISGPQGWFVRNKQALVLTLALLTAVLFLFALWFYVGRL